MSRLLVGHIPAESLPAEEAFAFGLDIKLEINEEGLHLAAARPGRGDTFAPWSPPEALIAQSAEVE